MTNDLVAGEEAVGLRLDVWLVQRLPSLSRARLQALIDEGCVLLDGERTRASPIGPGHPSASPASRPRRARPRTSRSPWCTRTHLLVVNKPAGLVVHPGAGAPDRHPRQRPAPPRARPLRGGAAAPPRHRPPPRPRHLGPLVVAKDDETHRAPRPPVRRARPSRRSTWPSCSGSLARAGRSSSHRPRSRASAEDVRPRAPRRDAGPTRTRGRFDGASLLRVRIHTGAPTRSACTWPHRPPRGRRRRSTAGPARRPRDVRPPARPCGPWLDRPFTRPAWSSCTRPRASAARSRPPAPRPPGLLTRLRAAGSRA